MWDDTSGGTGAKRKNGSGGRASKRLRGDDEGGPRVELEYEQELEEEEACGCSHMVKFYHIVAEQVI